MSDRDPRNVPALDLPWNDVPADSDIVPGTEEPDPAEVVGDDGEEVDVSHPRIPDIAAKYRRETLNERLAEEVPDVAARQDDPLAGEFQAAQSDEDDLTIARGEPDDPYAVGEDDEAAEDSAIHIRRGSRA
jgi:hypothetical protein